MCGIAGIIHFDGNRADPALLQKMTDLLRHRGPDGEGHWFNTEGSIGLGHRRLAIIDLSPKAAQPMIYEDRFVITLNGEIYNYIELRENLQKKGYTFRTNSDTEVLLAMYMEHGLNCLAFLDGMFAFVIYDKLEKTIFCARDRFGEKPFYYSFKQGHSFVFASEIKAILASGVPFRENYRMIYYFLAYQVVENPFSKEETFLEDVYSLEPAHYLLIDNKGRMNKNRYWDLKLDNGTYCPDPSKAAESVQEMFKESVNRRLRSDVSVGSSLSGGLDSSITVYSIYHQLNGGNSPSQKTFSARFDDPEKDEGRFIKKITDSIPLDSYETWVTGDHFRLDYDKIIWHQEEPIGGASPVAQWEVMKLAANEKVTVLLDGQGADEVFAGYHHYLRPFLTELFLKDKNTFKDQKKAYELLHGTELKLGNAFLLEARIPDLMRWIGKCRRATGTPSYLNDLHPDFLSSFKRIDPPFNAFTDLNQTLRYSTMIYGLGKLLKLADRNAMAFGREVRLPYLYHPLVEYLFSLPPTYKIRDGWTKWILRRAFEDIVPEEIIWRKDKMGYEPPIEKWMATAWFNENVRQAVSELKSLGILSRPRKEKNWFYLNTYNFLRIFKNQIQNIK
ncbi:MAG: asparagine synthase (glutamine-hydrolyzing) [Bacteroidales bacterium]